MAGKPPLYELLKTVYPILQEDAMTDFKPGCFALPLRLFYLLTK
jgi:hypothetical protein